MAKLQPMPPISISQAELAAFGETWKKSGRKLSKTSSGQLGKLFDRAVGHALSIMLGGLRIDTPTPTALTAEKECVEVGHVRIVGGIRPQNFDVGYRPDGIRIAFDSKTLNSSNSVKKNWQNMVNDLATEAATVHSRFPHALVAFMFVVPTPCIVKRQLSGIIETLERLSRRRKVNDPDYLAEAISLVIWNPEDGAIDELTLASESPLRIERFSQAIESIYLDRYRRLPPHDVAE